MVDYQAYNMGRSDLGEKRMSGSGKIGNKITIVRIVITAILFLQPISYPLSAQANDVHHQRSQSDKHHSRSKEVDKKPVNPEERSNSQNVRKGKQWPNNISPGTPHAAKQEPTGTDARPGASLTPESQ